MRIAIERQIAEILKGFPPAVGSEPSLPNMPAQDLSYFDVEEMRCVQRLRARKDALVDLESGWGLEKPFDNSRSVENDHRASRSPRTASAAFTPLTVER